MRMCVLSMVCCHLTALFAQRRIQACSISSSGMGANCAAHVHVIEQYPETVALVADDIVVAFFVMEKRKGITGPHLSTGGHGSTTEFKKAVVNSAVKYVSELCPRQQCGLGECWARVVDHRARASHFRLLLRTPEHPSLSVSHLRGSTNHSFDGVQFGRQANELSSTEAAYTIAVVQTPPTLFIYEGACGRAHDLVFASLCY